MSRMDPARRFSHTPKIIFLFFDGIMASFLFFSLIMPLKFPKIFVKYNNNHRTPMDTKTNNDQRAVAEFPLSVGGREVKKKASKKLPYNYEKKTTRRKKHNTNPTARVGQGWSGLGNTRRRASPIEAAACSETSWSFIYWRDFKRRKRKVIFFCTT